MRAHGPNPSGLCLCGCGQLTQIMDQNDRSQGLIKGEHRGFIHGHHRRKSVDPHTGPNSSGRCMCGCGEETEIATRTIPGLIEAGQHRRFILGHSKKGKVNPLGKIQRTERRRARKLDHFLEDIDRDVVYTMHGGMCGICKQFVSQDEFEVDHVIPLAAGGMHGYINVQPAHPFCNRSKGAKVL